jgi:hypothetical protein
MYSSHVCPLGGLKTASSIGEQVSFEFATPVASMPDTRYVKGETRYMKIQNLGRVAGVARTLANGA